MTYLSLFSAKTGICLIAIAGLSLSACASKPKRGGPPQDGARGPAKTSGTFARPIGFLFSDMDMDGNAVITRAELSEGIAAEWSTFDNNPGGAVFNQWALRKLGSTDAMPTFMAFDDDFNGVITKSEFEHRLNDEFTRLDKNSDGRVTRSELIQSVAAPQGRAQQERVRGEGGGRGKGGKGQGQGPRR